MVKAYCFIPKKCWHIYGCTYFRITYVRLVFITPSHAHDIIVALVRRNTKYKDYLRIKILSISSSIDVGIKNMKITKYFG